MGILQSTLKLSLIDNVSKGMRRINESVTAFERRALGPMSGTLGKLAAFGGAYIGVTQGLKSTVGAAIDFESAFSNVKKVVNATPEQFDNMRMSILNLSKQLPMTANDIASIYAAAGQSGIANNDFQRFTEIATKVGVAWDVTAADAGESLAKLQTGLGLTIDQTASLADAINFLDNNGASAAKDILDVVKRVGPMAKTFGFTAEQIAALGSAMTGSGFESEVVSTSILNIGRALTKGASATKRQESAFKKLGLSSTKVAKDMQKNAVGTLEDVLARINKLPVESRASAISDLFGDEARAIGPLVTNGKLLADTMGMVADKSKYAGSAFNEYVTKSNNVSNVLKLLQNKFFVFFEEIGARWLPTVKEAAQGVGDIIDTIGERASIFDRIGASVQGFLKGFGVDGGVRETINALGDLLFGKADGSGAADQLGRLFENFRKWGSYARELFDAIKNNPLVKFFADMAPYGFQIMLWGAGIAFLAGTVRKLASALMFLSGASTILATLKTVGSLAGLVGLGGTAAKTGAAAGAAGANTAAAGGLFSRVLPFLGSLATVAGLGAMQTRSSREQTPAEYRSMMDRDGPQWLKTHPFIPDRSDTYTGSESQLAAQRGLGYTPVQAAVDNGRSPVIIDASSIAAMTQPSGIQQVQITNPTRPSVTVSAPITITGVIDPVAAAKSAADQVGAAVKSAVESSMGGGGGF